MAYSVNADGFTLIESFLDAAEIDVLIAATEMNGQASARRSGVRNLLDVSEVRSLANSAKVRPLIEEMLGPEVRPVRGILFDKTADANWKVPWHQDVTIEVSDRVDVEGFGPWSIKSGILMFSPHLL